MDDDNRKNEKNKNFFTHSSPLLIKSVLMDIGLDFCRDEILHRLSPLNQLPDFGRGDVEEGDFLKIEVESRKMDPDLCLEIVLKSRVQSLWKLGSHRGLLKTWPGHHDEMAEGEEISVIPPGLNLHKSIPSQDEEEGVTTSLAKIPDRVDGV